MKILLAGIFIIIAFSLWAYMIQTLENRASNITAVDYIEVVTTSGDTAIIESPAEHRIIFIKKK